MSESPDEPATLGDVIIVMIVLLVIMFVLSASDSCGRRREYEDVRDRLERIENQRR